MTFKMDQIIRQIHQIGESPERIVSDMACPGLRASGLGMAGLTDAGRGYEMQRPMPPAGHLLVSFAGAGQVWTGEWTACGPGEAYLSPPLAPTGFRTRARQRWQFAWVFLMVDSNGASPMAVTQSTRINVDPRHFVNSVEGLYLEASGAARPHRLDLWAELVGEYTRSITQAGGAPDPLWRLWAEVDASLSEPWTLTRLADRAGVQPEALRRLSLRFHNRSPLRQVTHLRMRRAETLLRSTSYKLTSIAHQIGYDNPFAFSTAFSRWKGQSPKQFRSSDR
jgi:AraC-like DNA-binding protein